MPWFVVPIKLRRPVTALEAIMQVGATLELLISKHLSLLGLTETNQTKLLVSLCAVQSCTFFGLNPGTHVSLCHKIGLSGPRRTTSLLRLDLSTEIDPI